MSYLKNKKVTKD